MRNVSTLIIYHSKTGNNRKSADVTAKTLDADVMELDNDGSPTGTADLTSYSRVVFCFPVWAFSPCSPVKKFLKRSNLKGKKAAAVTICGGHPWRSGKVMKNLIEKCDGTFLGFASIKQSGDQDLDAREAAKKAMELLSA